MSAASDDSPRPGTTAPRPCSLEERALDHARRLAADWRAAGMRVSRVERVSAGGWREAYELTAEDATGVAAFACRAWRWPGGLPSSRTVWTVAVSARRADGPAVDGVAAASGHEEAWAQVRAALAGEHRLHPDLRAALAAFEPHAGPVAPDRPGATPAKRRSALAVVAAVLVVAAGTWAWAWRASPPRAVPVDPGPAGRAPDRPTSAAAASPSGETGRTFAAGAGASGRDEARGVPTQAAATGAEAPPSAAPVPPPAAEPAESASASPVPEPTAGPGEVTAAAAPVGEVPPTPDGRSPAGAEPPDRGLPGVDPRAGAGPAGPRADEPPAPPATAGTEPVREPVGPLPDGAAPVGTAERRAARPAHAPPPGRYAVQVAAVRDPAGAPEAWRRLAERHPALAGLRPRAASPVVVPGKGTLYRVAGGAFATEAEARAACERLSTGGLACVVVAP